MKIRSLTAAVLFYLCMVMFVVDSSAQTDYTIENCTQITDVYNYGDNDFLVVYISGDNYYTALTDETCINIHDTEICADNNAVSYNGEYLYFFENNIENNVPAVKICQYDFKYNSKKCFVINIDINVLQYRCAADRRGNFYFIDDKDVKIYTDSTLNHTVNLKSVPSMLIPSYDAESIFCVTDGNAAVIDSNGVYDIPLEADRIYPAKNGFSDSIGKVFSNDCTVLCDMLNGSHGSLMANGGFFGISNGNLVCIYNEKETSIRAMNSNAYLCMGSDRFIAVEEDSNIAEISFFNNEPVIPEELDTTNIESVSNESSFDINKFSLKNGYLCSVPPQSTIAEVKKMLNPKNCTVEFYGKDNTEKKSGTVGTGYIVRIRSESECSYIIVVYGDLSGEGNINTADRRKLTKYLLNSETLSKAESEAADLNHDDNVDLIDLAALNMYINTDKSIG